MRILRKNTCALFAVAALALLVSLNVYTPKAAADTQWTQSFTDSFNRADGTVGNGWTGYLGGDSIVSDQLQLTYPSSNPWHYALLRPTTENATSSRMVIDSPAGNVQTNLTSLFAILRYQDQSDMYVAGIYNKTLWIAKLVGDTATDVGPTISFTFNSADAYQLDFSATGTSPTTLSATITDTTTDTVVATATYTDSETVLQHSGQTGLYAYSNASPHANWLVSSVTTYRDADATAYTLSGPSSVEESGTSSNFTVTPNGIYTGTITPSDNGDGGTFTPSSLTFSNSDSPQTFVYQPASTGTKTISVSSSPALTDPPSLSLSVVSLATSYTLTGPSTATSTVFSSNFTVTPNGSYTGTITPSDGNAGGVFVPTSLTFASSSVAQTFKYMSETTGTKTISVSSSPSLTNPSSLSLSVNSEWGTVFSDTFDRADGAIGNNWIDPNSLATVSSDQLSLATVSGTALWRQATLRPTDENYLNQKISITMPAGVNVSSISGKGVFTILRYQDSSNLYWAGMFNNELFMGKVVGDSQTNYVTQTLSPVYDASDAYQLDFSATGTSPTTLTGTITDLTTGTIVATDTYTDSTSALQFAGQYGLYELAAEPWIVSSVTTYADTASLVPATSYTVSGPSNGVSQVASTNFTVTPNGIYTGTITPSDNGDGGTFTPSSLTFASSSDPQTFTYTPQSLGTKTISFSSSPALTNATSLSYLSHTADAGTVPITDSHLFWSPYDWYFNGSTYAQTGPGGGYLKVAFTGSTLALGIDSSNIGSLDPSSIILHAYIDGSTTPIAKTLANLSDDTLTFTNALSSGDHYAIIYLAQTPFPSDRWLTPNAAVRVTNVQLATDGTGNVLPLTDTPIAPSSKKVVFFGDSITEGYKTTGAEMSYAAVAAQNMGLDYGQIAYSGIGFDVDGPNNVPPLYDSTTPTDSFWRNYFSGETRMVDNSDLSQGFIGGTPNAVYLNMGSNDALQSQTAADLETKLALWLTDVRETIGSWPAIFVIVPSELYHSGYSSYKTYLLAGVSDYEAAHPSDKRVYVIDWGEAGYQEVLDTSTDGLHPDDAGDVVIGGWLSASTSPYIITPVTTVSNVSVSPNTTAATFSWNTDAVGSSIVDFGLTDSYSSSTEEFDNATSTRTESHSITVSGLTACTTYHYRVRSHDLALDTASSSDATFATTGCTGNAPITQTHAETITDHGSLTSGDLILMVPSGFSATTTNATFEANELTTSSFFTSAGTPTGRTRIGDYVVNIKAFIGEDTTLSTFTQPLTVTLSYDPSDLGSVDPSTLAIYRYDTGSGWTKLDNCSVDTTAHAVSCTTNAFSDFAIFGTSSGNNSSTTNTSNSSSGSILAGFTGTPNPLPGAVAMGTPTAPSTGTSVNTTVYTRDLHIGERGNDVATLQAYLTGQGYLAVGNITGYFGTLTQAALARYQMAHKISPAVGYFGPLTRASLGVSIANAGPTTDTNFTTSLVVGDTGSDVVHLQEVLTTLGLLANGASEGVFDAVTERAVQEFQCNEGIVCSGTVSTTGYGRVGPKTRMKLNSLP